MGLAQLRKSYGNLFYLRKNGNFIFCTFFLLLKNGLLEAFELSAPAAVAAAVPDVISAEQFFASPFPRVVIWISLLLPRGHFTSLKLPLAGPTDRPPTTSIQE